MKWSKIFGTTLLVGSLAACVSTQSINNEAANSYQQVKQQAANEGILDRSSPTAKRIIAVFNKMQPFAERENKTGVPFQWEITVLKSNELNAWAMPGGKMAFYTGLVDDLNLNDHEIATVMGHEMAHALQEHGKSDRAVSTATSVAATIGSIGLQAIGIQTNYGGIDLVGTIADLGVNKPFSRSQETEADEVGLMLMAKSGYNPQYAPKLWEKMAKATGGRSGLGALISTHPTNSARQENLQRLLPEAMKLYQTTTN